MFECQISQFRKKIAVLSDAVVAQLKLAEELQQQLGDTVTRDIAKDLAQNAEAYFDPDILEKSRSLLLAFCRQDKIDDFLHFIKIKNGENISAVYRQILGKLDPATLPLIEGWRETFNPLIGEHLLFLECTILKSVKKGYKLAHSAWNPAQPIDSLMEELRQHGPQIVTGHLGRFSYIDPPITLSDPIANQPVFAWRDATRKELSYMERKEVVVVGARKRPKPLVYYLDPYEQEQKFYLVSYENFKRYVQPFEPSESVPETYQERTFTIYNPTYPNNYR